MRREAGESRELAATNPLVAAAVYSAGAVPLLPGAVPLTALPTVDAGPSFSFPEKSAKEALSHNFE